MVDCHLSDSYVIVDCRVSLYSYAIKKQNQNRSTDKVQNAGSERR